MSSRIVGIDLGTVNSCVAIVEDGRARVLAEDSRTTIPSCVAFIRGKEIVGHGAKRQAVTEPLNTVSAVKRILGHAFESPEVQTVLAQVPYPIKPSPLGGVLLEIGGRDFTPIQISSRVLQRVREMAEKSLGEPVRRAVISVPAHFNDVQRKATKLAAEYAGLEVVRLLNEPTAAAFAYGYRRGEDLRLAVYDLGGGTFDITVLSAQGDCFRVDATDGDSFLGGEDFDLAIMEWLMDEFHREFGHELRGDRAAELRLREAAEQAKIALSEVEETKIELAFLAQLEDGSRPLFSRKLNRAKLEELSRPLIEKTLQLCQRCLESAKIKRSQINEVLLVGGQSRMACVRDAVRDFFGREPRRDINPDEVVAMGAALYAYSISAQDLRAEAEAAAEDAYAVALKDMEVAKRLLDEVEKARSHVLGDNTLVQRLEILLAQTEADGPIDTASAGPQAEDADLPEAVGDLQERLIDLDQKAEELLDQLVLEFATEGEGDSAGSATVERAAQHVTTRLEAARAASDQAQAHLGQAEQHAKARKVTLIDVTSRALGIASVEDLFSVLIEKNVPIPTQKTRTFTTHSDGQAEVSIRVHQGEKTRASKNQFLGEFVLQGIAPAPRMQPRIDVAFTIDESGILSVRARDAVAGREHGMRVEDPLELQHKLPSSPSDEDAGSVPVNLDRG